MEKFETLNTEIKNSIITLSEYLKKYRRQVLHLTQEQIAERCNVSIRTIQLWESGKKIPRAYNLTTFFEGDEDSCQRAQELRLELIDNISSTVTDKSALQIDEGRHVFGTNCQGFKATTGTRRKKKGPLERLFSRFVEENPQYGEILVETEYSEDDIFKIQKNRAGGNRNVFNNILLFGDTGSGKTRKLIKYISEDVNSNEEQNFLICDPAGAIKEATFEMAQAKGYQIFDINLNEVDIYSLYNAIPELLSDGSASATDIEEIQQMIVETFVANDFRQADNHDPFWDEAISLRLKDLLSLKDAADFYSGDISKAPVNEMFAYLPEKTQAAVDVGLRLILHNFLNSGPKNDINKFLAERAGKPIVIKTDTKFIETLKNLKDLNKNGGKFICYLSFTMYPSESDILRTQIALNTVIATMQYSQKESSRMKGDSTGRAATLLNLYIDEFANVIGKDNCTFAKNISAFFKFDRIRCIAALQTINQLKSIFGKDWETVATSFNNRIFLHTSDFETCDYISYVFGNKTIFSDASDEVVVIKVMPAEKILALPKEKEIICTNTGDYYICDK